MFANKTIGEAKYLQKGNGDYIPFRMEIEGSNCDKFNKMIESSNLMIKYIPKDENKN
jgi:hypothetical protein